MYADLLHHTPAPSRPKCVHDTVNYNPATRLYECACGETWVTIDLVRDAHDKIREARK